MTLGTRQYFGLPQDAEVAVDDARQWLRRANTRYDLIVHDTFTGGATPEHLLSIEALSGVHDLLHRGGLLALNFVGHSDDAESAPASAIAKTLQAVFREVRLYGDDSDREALTNLVFLASDLPIEASTRDSNTKAEQCSLPIQALSRVDRLLGMPQGSVLTDAMNPLTRLSLSVAEEHFVAMNALLPPGVWLNDSVRP